MLDDGVESELLIIAEMYQKLEADELAIQKQENKRLDQFVVDESNKAVDDTVMEMIIEGRFDA